MNLGTQLSKPFPLPKFSLTHRSVLETDLVSLFEQRAAPPDLDRDRKNHYSLTDVIPSRELSE